MPLYEYRCKNCNYQFEKIQKFSDEPVTVCPECAHETVEQLLSAPAVQFKGSGWYVTDYARKGKGDGSSSSTSTAFSSAATSAAKPTTTESK